MFTYLYGALRLRTLRSRDDLSLFLDPVVCLFLLLSNLSFFKIVHYLSLELFILASQILCEYLFILYNDTCQLEIAHSRV